MPDQEKVFNDIFQELGANEGFSSVPESPVNPDAKFLNLQLDWGAEFQSAFSGASTVEAVEGEKQRLLGLLKEKRKGLIINLDSKQSDAIQREAQKLEEYIEQRAKSIEETITRDTRISELNGELKDSGKHVTTLDKEITGHSARIDELNKKIQDNSAKIANSEKSNYPLDGDILNALKAVIVADNQALTALKAELDTKQEKKAELESKITELTKLQGEKAQAEKAEAKRQRILEIGEDLYNNLKTDIGNRIAGVFQEKGISTDNINRQNILSSDEKFSDTVRLIMRSIPSFDEREGEDLGSIKEGEYDGIVTSVIAEKLFDVSNYYELDTNIQTKFKELTAVERELEEFESTESYRRVENNEIVRQNIKNARNSSSLKNFFSDIEDRLKEGKTKIVLGRYDAEDFSDFINACDAYLLRIKSDNEAKNQSTGWTWGSLFSNKPKENNNIKSLQELQEDIRKGLKKITFTEYDPLDEFKQMRGKNNTLELAYNIKSFQENPNNDLKLSFIFENFDKQTGNSEKEKPVDIWNKVFDLQNPWDYQAFQAEYGIFKDPSSLEAKHYINTEDLMAYFNDTDTPPGEKEILTKHAELQAKCQEAARKFNELRKPNQNPS